MAGTISYIAAPQANIYFDGILIDECYDIQYSYREAKEPIYGYLSQHFDAVLKGTVLITGALTINYKHDQYLTAVLNKAASPVGKIVSKNLRPVTLKKYQQEYKQALINYADEMKRQAKLEAEYVMLQKKAELIQASADKQRKSDEGTVNTNIDNAELAMMDFQHSIDLTALQTVKDSYKTYEQELIALEDQIATSGSTQEEQELIARNKAYLDITFSQMDDADPNFRTYYDLSMALRAAQKASTRLFNEPLDFGNTSSADGRIQELEKELLAIDLPGLRNRIDVIRGQINSITVSDTQLAGAIPIGNEAVERLDTTRAEDFRNGFTIEFNYNGSPHKRILNCQLLGHGHVVTQSGMPIKEQYTFIAKKLE